jgi:hypothetical protein
VCFEDFHPRATSPAQFYGGNMANGLFSDAHWYVEGEEDLTEPCPCSQLCPREDYDLPVISQAKMTMAYLQGKGDGASQTLMLSENLRAVSWAFQNNQAYRDDGSPRDEKYHFGFCWEQPDVVSDAIANDSRLKQRRINGGESHYDEYIDVPDIKIDDGFPSSNHPGGVNAAFVAGATKFISDDIDLRVYAQLMTSNRKSTDLHVADVYEPKLPPLGNHEY